jgi:hypothetical protein
MQLLKLVGIPMGAGSMLIDVSFRSSCKATFTDE